MKRRDHRHEQSLSHISYKIYHSYPGINYIGFNIMLFAVVEDSNVKAPTHYMYPLKKDIYTALVRIQVAVCHFFY